MATVVTVSDAPANGVHLNGAPSGTWKPEQVQQSRIQRSIALLCGGFLLTLGVSVLLGWAFDIPVLITVIPGHISMKANAALGFVACAVALLTARTRRIRSRLWCQLAGCCVLLLGLSTLLEYRLGVDLHIDQLLFQDHVQFPYPGRMAEISARGFCLAGFGLIAVGGGKRANQLAQLAGLLIVADAFAGIVGFLYGVPLFFGSLGYTSMAIHTGAAFLVLGCGLVVVDPDSDFARTFLAQERGGWLARRLLPGAILLPVALGWLYMSPRVDFGRPRFAMAIFAVTMVASAVLALWFGARFLNRSDRERAEIVDIRERSLSAVQQSERELRLVTDHLPTLLSYIDTEGRLLRVNRTYEAWLGLPAERIVGRTIRDLLGDAYWLQTLPAREAALTGVTRTIETPYPTVLGDRQAQVTYAPDIDDQGQVRGFACMVLDVEEQRRAEAALRQSEKLAVVGRLASSIAHEINNPLEAVTNLLYLAAMDSDQSSPASQYVAEAQKELARVTHIVVQTLKFHRQSTYPTAALVSELADQVMVLYGARIAQAGVTVETRYRSTPALFCHEGELRQVLANLIGNATDAMASPGPGRARGGRLLVRTRAAQEPSSERRGVRITVADTGHGIPPHTLLRLGEPFHTTKGETGSGLGLWVSKGIIDRHAGTLKVRSSIQQGRSGTVFSIFLPHDGVLDPLAAS